MRQRINKPIDLLMNRCILIDFFEATKKSEIARKSKFNDAKCRDEGQ